MFIYSKFFEIKLKYLREYIKLKYLREYNKINERIRIIKKL